MKVLKVLEDAELVLADLEVNILGEQKHSITLCVRHKGQIIPLNTPDMRPVLMAEENAIEDIGIHKGRTW
jgi:hypothetical protein